VSTSSIVTHYIGWGCHTPNSQETHSLKWEFCGQFEHCFSWMYSWCTKRPACIQKSKNYKHCAHPERPWGPPSSYTVSTRSFNGVKWLTRGHNHLSPSSAEVKERVELYLCAFLAGYRVNFMFTLLPWSPGFKSAQSLSDLWQSSTGIGFCTSQSYSFITTLSCTSKHAITTSVFSFRTVKPWSIIFEGTLERKQ